MSFNFMRGSSMVEFLSHKQEDVGSTPTLAPIYREVLR